MQAIQNSHWNAHKSSVHLTTELNNGEGGPSSNKNMYVCMPFTLAKTHT